MRRGVYGKPPSSKITPVLKSWLPNPNPNASSELASANEARCPLTDPFKAPKLPFARGPPGQVKPLRLNRIAVQDKHKTYTRQTQDKHKTNTTCTVSLLSLQACQRHPQPSFFYIFSKDTPLSFFPSFFLSVRPESEFTVRKHPPPRRKYPTRRDPQYQARQIIGPLTFFAGVNGLLSLSLPLSLSLSSLLS